MIVAVYGSPRTDGNTDILMDTFLDAVQTQEKVVKFKLRDMLLKPCTGCCKCYKTGICVFNDDIWSIYEHIEKADGLILSSPIYFASVTAQLKTFIDRGQAFWVRKFILKQQQKAPGKKGFYISAGAMTVDKYFINSRLVIRSFMVSLDIKCAGELFFPGIDKKGEIRNQPEALNSAYKAGLDFTTIY
ncbi:MAG TPA: flavodoxin family protein [Clostridiales bacterium]|nr:flavodoxin family protein [Clostridiales bacterium]